MGDETKNGMYEGDVGWYAQTDEGEGEGVGEGVGEGEGEGELMW